MADYSYDRTKTAAKMDLHSEWKDIVSKHQEAEARDMAELVKKLVPYLKSVGLDLNVQKSAIYKYDGGSDGWRLEGYLEVTDRDENNTPTDTPQKAAMWVDEAIGIRGSARLLKKGPEKGRNHGEPLCTWAIDLLEA